MLGIQTTNYVLSRLEIAFMPERVAEREARENGYRIGQLMAQWDELNQGVREARENGSWDDVFLFQDVLTDINNELSKRTVIDWNKDSAQIGYDNMISELTEEYQKALQNGEDV